MALAGVLVLGLLVNSLWGQSIGRKIGKHRMEAIERCKENNTKELIIPRVPIANIYCYGADLSGDYWLKQLQRILWY